MIPIAGQDVGGAFLEYKIAEGKTASTWAAKHVTLGRDVAVRLFSTSQEAPDGAYRFERNGRAMARIKSPHVPEIFGAGRTADGAPYIIMELLVGRRLSAWAVQHGRLSLDETARVVDDVGAALATAHVAGIVHRRLTPESIVVSGEPHELHAKLLDFDDAESIDGSLSGAPPVGAPSTDTLVRESNKWFIEAQHADRGALAVVAYWCLTGRHPLDPDTFETSTLGEERHVVRPSDIRADVPLDLDGWFDRALCRDVRLGFSCSITMAKMFRLAAVRHPLLPTDRTRASSAPQRLEARAPRGWGPASTRGTLVRVIGGAALTLVGAVGAALAPSSPAVHARTVAASSTRAEPIAPIVSTVPEETSLAPPASNGAAQALVLPMAAPLAEAVQPSVLAPRGRAYPAGPPLERSSEPASRPTATVGNPAAWSPTDELGEPGERSAPH